MSNTQVSICNLALGHISTRSITSISDTDDPRAVACNLVWAPSLEETLRSNDWAFARSIVALVKSATYDPEPYGKLYAYVIPSNSVALRSVFNAYTKNKVLGEGYERLYDPDNDEELVLVDFEDAYARYTYNLTDPTKFDSFFVTALSFRLAASLSPILVNDETKTTNLIKSFNNAISDAQRMDSYENPGDTSGGNTFVDARS